MIVQPTPVPRRREEIRVNLQLRTAVGVGGSRASGGEKTLQVFSSFIQPWSHVTGDERREDGNVPEVPQPRRDVNGSAAPPSPLSSSRSQVSASESAKGYCKGGGLAKTGTPRVWHR